MSVQVIQGDCLAVLKTLPDESVNCCVTSPPYWGLRDYGVEGQLGLERTPEEYVSRMVEVFREVRRVLRDDGTLWLNFGDSYNANGRAGQGSRIGCKQGTNRASAAGLDRHRPTAPDLKPKDLVGIPWMVAFALRADGWYLRQDIIWHKPNPMPESVTDRCTKAHEYIFLMSKSQRYFYDNDSVREPYNESSLDRYRYALQDTCDTNGKHKPGNEHLLDKPPRTKVRPPNDAGRNRRSVWTVTTIPFPGAHFATFPPKLIEPCILAGCPKGGTVLDPFGGSGTVGMVAENNGRNAILIELNPKYVEMAKGRTAQRGLFTAAAAEGG